MLQIDPIDREKLIDPLYRSGTAFRLIVVLLAAAVAWGVYNYARQVTLGLGQTGMQRPVYWGTYMVNFIFFIGISHAGTLISAILRVTGAEWRRPITRIAEAVTAFALIVGTLQIIIDMGRPDRLLFVITNGRLQSPILWDVVAVTAYFLGSVTYLFLPLIPDAAIMRDNMPEYAPRWRRRLYTLLALGWRGNVEQWRRLEKAIGFMAIFIIPVAISVHTIISWILATTVQPGWHSAIFGPYFVVGAIFSGIAALFLAMTAVRSAFGLEKYIKLKQYRNLGLLFIVMNIVWAYFTYTETLTLAAGQEETEFPVLASKLWGADSTAFWVMILMMVFAFIVMVVPGMMPASARRLPLLKPRFAVGSSAAALVGFVLLEDQQFSSTVIMGQDSPYAGVIVTVLIGWALIGTLLGLCLWLKERPVIATLIAGVAVLIGMWLERWSIIVPTMTHPRLIPYASYAPTETEISLTVASLALFVLLFVVFFKLFPAVSLWEIAEGRVVDEANSKLSIPMPEPTPVRHKWLQRRRY